MDEDAAHSEVLLFVAQGHRAVLCFFCVEAGCFEESFKAVDVEKMGEGAVEAPVDEVVRVYKLAAMEAELRCSS